MAKDSTVTNRFLAGKKVLQYPMGLGSHPVDSHGYDSQYLMIKINSPDRASTLRDDKLTGPVVVTNSRTGSGVAVQKISDKTLNGLAEVVSNLGYDPKFITDQTTAKNADRDLVLKYDEKTVNSEVWRTQKGMSRLDKVIILPMPNEHTVGTSVQYNQNYDPMGITKAGDVVNQLGGNVMGELATLVAPTVISGILNTLKSGLADQRGLLAEQRLALNPKKEVMFDSFGYRQFSFRYSFAPKNEEESNMVSSIIETLRYYSLPEISTSKFFYILPAEFEISFMLGGKDNPHIPRITTSVLQRVGVNYSPNSGVWASLPNGAPLAIDLTLEFLELELVDRNRVWNKNSPITSGY